MAFPNLLDIFDKLKLFVGYEFNNNLGLINLGGFIVILLAIKIHQIFLFIAKLGEVLFYFICKAFSIKDEVKPPIFGEKKSKGLEYVALFIFFVVCICFVKGSIGAKL